jgi:hypothetical protein
MKLELTKGDKHLLALVSVAILWSIIAGHYDLPLAYGFLVGSLVQVILNR